MSATANAWPIIVTNSVSRSKRARVWASLVDHNLKSLVACLRTSSTNSCPQVRRQTGFTYIVQSANLQVGRSFLVAIACKVGEIPGDRNDSIIGCTPNCSSKPIAKTLSTLTGNSGRSLYRPSIPKLPAVGVYGNCVADAMLEDSVSVVPNSSAKIKADPLGALLSLLMKALGLPKSRAQSKCFDAVVLGSWNFQVIFLVLTRPAQVRIVL